MLVLARSHQYLPNMDELDRIDTVRGMDITICTTARTDDEARALLAAFGFPFRTAETAPSLIEPTKRSRRPRGRK